MKTFLSRHRRIASAVAAGLCLAATALSGCSAEQLRAMQFHKDNRLIYTSPQARSLVQLPVRISWRFEESGKPGTQRYGVFVDRSPMPVGKGLKELASDDRSCERDPRCPGADYLANLGVYVTTQDALRLDVLPQVGGVGDEQHTVTVVLLDKSGVRHSESAWYVDFRLRRRS